MHINNKLITLRDSITKEFVNDLTKEMDRHLLYGHKFQTYLTSKKNSKCVILRFPGATRGHLTLDDNNIITDIVLYETACDNCIRCYSHKVRESIKQFIGMELVVAENPPRKRNS